MSAVAMPFVKIETAMDRSPETSVPDPKARRLLASVVLPSPVSKSMSDGTGAQAYWTSDMTPATEKT